MLRETTLVILKNRSPTEEDDLTDVMQFQVDRAVRCWLLGGSQVAVPLLDVLIECYPRDAHPQYVAGCILSRTSGLAALPYLEKAMQFDRGDIAAVPGESRRLITRLRGPDEGDAASIRKGADGEPCRGTLDEVERDFPRSSNHPSQEGRSDEGASP